MLEVRVLGELELQRDDDPVALPAGRPARSLLALLALERREHARSQVAARLWPDVLDASARTSLRGALAALRKALGPDADRYLVATRERVGLSEAVRTDAAEFDRLVAADRLEEAVALWRGELLSGLDDEWVLVARDAWRDKAAEALAALAQRAEAAGALGAAVGHARAMVALDPLAEEAQRTLIRLLAAAGDRAAALATYGRYADRLRSELGVAPSPATRALHAELREADAAPSPHRRPPAPSPSCSPTSWARPSCSTPSATRTPSDCGGRTSRSCATSRSATPGARSRASATASWSRSPAASTPPAARSASSRRSSATTGASGARRWRCASGCMRASRSATRTTTSAPPSWWPGACATAPRAARS